MTSELESVLSDLIDGEDVCAETLAAALREPGATETLVDFARSRRAVAGGDERPSDRFYASMKPLMQPQAEWRMAAWQPLPWLAVAALLVLVALGSAMLGRVTAPTVEREGGVYCTDRTGAAHLPGTMTKIDGLVQECVTRGDWFPVVR